MSGFTLLLQTIPQNLIYLIQDLNVGDLQGAWDAIINHFEVNTRRNTHLKCRLFFQLVLLKNGIFSRFVSAIRKAAKDLNIIQGETWITEGHMMSVLLSGVLEHNHARYNTVVTILEQKKGLTFEECVLTILPVAVREESNSGVSEEEAHMTPVYMKTTVKNPKQLVCYSWQRNGTCSYGKNCRFSHNGGGGGNHAPSQPVPHGAIGFSRRGGGRSGGGRGNGRDNGRPPRGSRGGRFDRGSRQIDTNDSQTLVAVITANLQTTKLPTVRSFDNNRMRLKKPSMSRNFSRRRKRRRKSV